MPAHQQPNEQPSLSPHRPERQRPSISGITTKSPVARGEGERGEGRKGEMCKRDGRERRGGGRLAGQIRRKVRGGLETEGGDQTDSGWEARGRAETSWGKRRRDGRVKRWNKDHCFGPDQQPLMRHFRKSLAEQLMPTQKKYRLGTNGLRLLSHLQRKADQASSTPKRRPGVRPGPYHRC